MKYMQLCYFTELRMKLSALNRDPGTYFQIPNPQTSLIWKPSLARRLHFLLVQEIHSLLEAFLPHFSLHTFTDLIQISSPPARSSSGKSWPWAPLETCHEMFQTRRSPERAGTATLKQRKHCSPLSWVHSAALQVPLCSQPRGDKWWHLSCIIPTALAPPSLRNVSLTFHSITQLHTKPAKEWFPRYPTWTQSSLLPLQLLYHLQGKAS